MQWLFRRPRWRAPGPPRLALPRPSSIVNVERDAHALLSRGGGEDGANGAGDLPLPADHLAHLLGRDRQAHLDVVAEAVGAHADQVRARDERSGDVADEVFHPLA